MKKSIFYKMMIHASLFLGAFSLISCDEESTLEPIGGMDADKQAMIKLIDQDSLISSFIPNFDEDGIMELSKAEADIVPFRIGHKMKLVSRDLSIDIRDSVAFGTLTRIFNGTLFIATSYDPDAIFPDTIITKTFSKTVTKKIIFLRIADTPDPMRNWIIAAVSLAEGKTEISNIDLKKLTVISPGKDTLVIEGPTNYFINRRINWWKKLPVLNPGDSILVQAELTSLYEGDDLVTVTFGADLLGAHRLKRKFNLVSSTFNGSGYDKVYEQYFVALYYPGFYHAIFNALSNSTVYADDTPVELESWGLPYFITP